MCDRIACPPPPKRLRISELNPHLLCALCGGYLIDATTIIECLHSFCKTCILRYLETSTYCPICEVLIHKTRPWQNIRLDHSLQNAVYKMVPGLFHDEMKRRREFYEKQNQQDKRGRSRSQPQGEFGDRIIFSQDEEFSISIEFSPDGKPVKDVKENRSKSLKRTNSVCQPDKRYLKCPAALRVQHLKKFIRSKFSLPQSLEIDLFYEAEPLSETYSLMDVAYIYHWKRDCVLRLFYSFYEIPPKVRKVETVTNVTEKISKNVLKDKSEEKSDKGEEGKKSKNKRERSKEKKQGKLSGKRKVCTDGSVLFTDGAVVVTESPNTDSCKAVSAKCQEIDVAATTNVCSAEYIKPSEAASKADRDIINSLPVAKCSKKGHTTFQSPTKQKPPPETPPFSIIDQSSNKDSNKVAKGRTPKTSIKLLIKSSDIKECKSPNSEFLATTKNVKLENNNMPSKIKIKKYQNGDSVSISSSNLFEKMSALASSAEVELKDRALIAEPFSSQFHGKLYSNNKTMMEGEFLKCDIKTNVNIAKMNTASKPDVLVDNKRTESNVTGEVVIKDDIQAGNDCMSKQENTKLEKCNNICQENKVDCDAGKEQTAVKIKVNSQESKVITKSSNPTKTDCKAEIHSPKLSGAQDATFNHDNKVTCDMQQTAHSLNGRTQDTNQNDIKLGQPEQGSGVDSLKENGINSPTSDTKLIAVKTEPFSTAEDASNSRKLCGSINHTRSHLSVTDAKRITAHPEKTLIKRASEDSNKHSIKGHSDATGLFDPHMVALQKANHATSEIPAVLPKLQNGVTPVAEISSVQTPVKIINVQEVSKAGRETADKEPLCGSNKKAFLERVLVSSQSENKPMISSPCSDVLVNLSKPMTSEIMPAENSDTTKVKANSSQVKSAEPTTSSKLAFVSGVLTTTTSSSPSPALPKLLKTIVISTAASSYSPASYSIASIVSVPVFRPGSLPSSSLTTASLAPSASSSAAATGVVPKRCEVTTTVPHKAALRVVCTTTLTKASLAVPATSSVAPVTSSVAPVTSSAAQVTSSAALVTSSAALVTSSAALVTSSAAQVVSSASASSVDPRAIDSGSFPVTEQSSEPSSSSPVYRRTMSGSTTSVLPASVKTIASMCIPSAASLSRAATPTTGPSIILPGTQSPTTSSTSPPTSVVTPLALTVTSTVSNSWCTDTTVNVANTFLNMPSHESSALMNTQTKSGHRVSEFLASSKTLNKEPVKLDNFLFDTKPSETDSFAAVSSHKVKDSCTVSRHVQKGPMRNRPNSSAQSHGLMMNSKTVTSSELPVTAVYQLPKTVPHTTKPYSVTKSTSVSSAPSTKCNSIIQTTKISTLIPKSSSVSSKAGTFSKSFSYPSTLNSVPSSRSFLHTSLPPHMPRPDLSAAINGSSGYERALLTKASALSSSASSVHMATAASPHRTSSKHSSKDADGKMEKPQKNKAVPPLTIPKSCLTTLKLQRSPGSTDHYIFAPLSHYTAAVHHNGDRSKSKEVKYNGSRTPTSPPTPTKDNVFIGERQRVPTIKISDINRNPIIVESGGSNHGNSSNRQQSQFRAYSHGSSRSSSSDSGSARAHSRGGSDSNSPTGSSDRSDRSPARDARRPSDSELLLSQHWHGYSAADLLFNGFKLPSHPKFHELHYDTDAMPLDYSQSSSKS